MAIPTAMINGKIVSISRHAMDRVWERTSLTVDELCYMLNNSLFRKIGAPPTRSVTYKPRKHDRVKRDMTVELATVDGYVIYSVLDNNWYMIYVRGQSVVATVMPLDWVRDRPVPPSIKEAVLRDAIYGQLSPMIPRIAEVCTRAKQGMYDQPVIAGPSPWEAICSQLTQSWDSESNSFKTNITPFE